MKRKLRILLVDDSQSLRKLIRGFIESNFDAEIFEAGDGEAAERILQEQSILTEPVDLLVLDWMMPKVSGYALLKKIRSTAGFFKQPSVIMLTAETYPDQINACMKYEVSKYLIKPFTQEQIKGAIGEIIQERGLKDAV
jgi:two-component system chemotaxis response regulator CheY